MPDSKISGLKNLSVASSGNLLAIVDLAAIPDETKKITIANLMGSPGPIGGTTPSTGEFTTIQVTSGATISEFSIDGTLTGDSDLAIPTEKAVKTYVDAQIATTDEHNELQGIQGGDSTNRYHLTLAQRDGLTDGGETALHSHSAATFAHNTLGSIQGGDSTNEYYHLTQEIHDQITSTPTAILFSGGTKVSGHSAMGTDAAIDTAAVLDIDETLSGFVARGIYIQAENSNTTSFNYMRGIESHVEDIQNSLLTTELISVHAYVNQVTGNATLTDVIGVNVNVAGPGEGTAITNQIGGKFITTLSNAYISPSSVTYMAAIEAQINSSDANTGANFSITNAYGINIKSPGTFNAGTATNLYGLYIADHSLSDFDNEYNIYSAGVNSKNKFEGSIELATGPSVNEISNDDTLSGDSTSVLVTEQAIKGYVDAQITAEVITGQDALFNGDSTGTVVFASAEVDTNYSIGYSLVNTVDTPPSIYPSIVTEKTVNGFEVLFSGPLDSANYVLDWSITR